MANGCIYSVMRPIFLIFNNTETTTMAPALSPLWYPQSTTSIELSHLTSANDAQIHENRQLFWLQKPKDINSSLPYSTSYPGAGVWNSSLTLFQESAKDNKNESVHSALPDYRSTEQVQEVKKFESAPACRLFGFDLRNNSNKRSDADGILNVDPLNSSKERKHVQLEVSTNEMQEKQNSTSSSRTRIKVS